MGVLKMKSNKGKVMNEKFLALPSLSFILLFFLIISFVSLIVAIFSIRIVDDRKVALVLIFLFIIFIFLLILFLSFFQIVYLYKDTICCKNIWKKTVIKINEITNISIQVSVKGGKFINIETDSQKMAFEYTKKSFSKIEKYCDKYLGKVFFKYGKKQRMLESTYIITDSTRNLNNTNLGKEIIKLQEIYNRL